MVFVRRAEQQNRRGDARKTEANALLGKRDAEIGRAALERAMLRSFWPRLSSAAVILFGPLTQWLLEHIVNIY